MVVVIVMVIVVAMVTVMVTVMVIVMASGYSRKWLALLATQTAVQSRPSKPKKAETQTGTSVGSSV